MGRRLLAALAAAIAILGLCSSAGAQIVVGQTASAALPPEGCLEPADEIQLTLESGASYRVPTAGLLTSWSTFAGPGPAQILTFKVFRKTAPFTYLVVARDARALVPNSLNSFSTSIPVQGGDTIGLAVSGAPFETPCAFQTGVPGASEDRIMFADGGDVPAGGTVAFPGTVESGYRLNVSATLLPPPTVTSISPPSGSLKSGSVVISGTNLSSAYAVMFGDLYARSFKVDSDGQITATVPTRKTLATVPVSVTTSAGVAVSPTPYAYEGCVVPRLKGKRLKPSRKLANRADCKIGKVTKIKGATGKTGKVVRQHPKPGKVLASDTKIKVTLKL